MTLAILEKDGRARIEQHAHATVWAIEINETELDYVIESLELVRDEIRNKTDENQI